MDDFSFVEIEIDEDIKPNLEDLQKSQQLADSSEKVTTAPPNLDVLQKSQQLADSLEEVSALPNIDVLQKSQQLAVSTEKLTAPPDPGKKLLKLFGCELCGMFFKTYYAKSKHKKEVHIKGMLN